MWRYNSPDELYHYGILGMKWGRRKAKYSSSNNPKYKKKYSSARPKAKPSYISKDSKRVKNIKRKHIDEMTNEELKVANNRLNLEKQYKDLTRRQSVGQKAVKTFIGVAGTIAAIEASAKTYKRVTDYAVKKIGKTRLRNS